MSRRPEPMITPATFRAGYGPVTFSELMFDVRCMHVEQIEDKRRLLAKLAHRRPDGLAEADVPIYRAWLQRRIAQHQEDLAALDKDFPAPPVWTP